VALPHRATLTVLTMLEVEDNTLLSYPRLIQSVRFVVDDLNGHKVYAIFRVMISRSFFWHLGNCRVSDGCASHTWRL
jgi:hypothetical protein